MHIDNSPNARRVRTDARAANALQICLAQPSAGRLLGGPAAEALGAVRLPNLSRDSRTHGPYSSDRAPVTRSLNTRSIDSAIAGPMAQQIIVDTPPNCARSSWCMHRDALPSGLIDDAPRTPFALHPHAYRRGLKQSQMASSTASRDCVALYGERDHGQRFFNLRGGAEISTKRRREAPALSIAIDLVVSRPLAQPRPSGAAAARSQERATANSRPLRISYLVFALAAAAAAVAEGSAKAITASPSIPGASIGLPPKP
jgi:hypothetical protein